MKTVVCHCGHSFEADIPERVNLDEKSADVSLILEGRFLTLACPSCKGELRPEERISFAFKGSAFTWLPETERWRFLHNADRYVADEKVDTPAVVFGYGELAERVAIVRDGLDPFLVELVKLMLLSKVPDESRSAALSLRYRAMDKGDVLFLVAGLPGDKAAELRFPAKTWEGLKADRASLVQDLEYACMVVGPYTSYTNVDLDLEEGAPESGAGASN